MEPVAIYNGCHITGNWSAAGRYLSAEENDLAVKMFDTINKFQTPNKSHYVTALYFIDMLYVDEKEWLLSMDIETFEDYVLEYWNDIFSYKTRKHR